MKGYPTFGSDNEAAKSATSADAKRLVKEEFAKRLYSAILAKGWTQAELGRRSGLARDPIAKYVRGDNLPSPPALQAIADALGVKAEELLPSIAEIMQGGMASVASLPAFEFTEVSPGRVRLRVNKVVQLSTAMKIGQLITDDDAPSAD